jgi:Flp pilus assembly protein TadG
MKCLIQFGRGTRGDWVLGRRLPRFGTSEKPFRSDSGSVAIETALAFMLIITLMVGIIECCVMMYTFSVVAEAARHGVRYATIHGSASSNCSGPSTGCTDSTGANVVTDVTTFANQFVKNVSGLTVQVTYPDTGGSTAPSRVTVGVTYTYVPMFVSGMRHSFHVSSQGRILY